MSTGCFAGKWNALFRLNLPVWARVLVSGRNWFSAEIDRSVLLDFFVDLLGFGLSGLDPRVAEALILEMVKRGFHHGKAASGNVRVGGSNGQGIFPLFSNVQVAVPEPQRE